MVKEKNSWGVLMARNARENTAEGLRMGLDFYGARGDADTAGILKIKLSRTQFAEHRGG